MINRLALKKEIAKKGYTISSLSKEIGINTSTFFRKLKQGDSFSIGEVNKIFNVLQLTKEEGVEIFFT